MKNYKAENLESLSASIYPFNCKDFNYPLSIIHYPLSIVFGIERLIIFSKSVPTASVPKLK